MGKVTALPKAANDPAAGSGQAPADETIPPFDISIAANFADLQQVQLRMPVAEAISRAEANRRMDMLVDLAQRQVSRQEIRVNEAALKDKRKALDLQQKRRVEQEEHHAAALAAIEDEIVRVTAKREQLDVDGAAEWTRMNPAVVNTDPNIVPGQGPTNLPAGYLRMKKNTFVWLFSGVPYPLINMDDEDYDQQVQQVGIASLARDYITDLSNPGNPTFTIYPPTNRAYPYRGRCHIRMPDIGSSAVPQRRQGRDQRAAGGDDLAIEPPPRSLDQASLHAAPRRVAAHRLRRRRPHTPGVVNELITVGAIAYGFCADTAGAFAGKDVP